MTYEQWSKHKHMKIPPTVKHTYVHKLLFATKHKLCSTSANKNPIATVTVTRRHPVTFSIISFDRDIFGPNGSCPLKASVIQNIIQVWLTSGISLSGSWGLRKVAFGWGLNLALFRSFKILLQTQFKLVMCPTSYHHWPHKFSSRVHP